MIQTTSSADTLLNYVTALRKAQELAGEQPGRQFNIFQLLGLESDEVRTHSQFLAEMLNPNGSHGVGDAFLKLWLDQLGIKDFETMGAKSIVEHYIGPVSETNGGRIDIMIASKSGKIVIENKVFAGDQKNQLLRYYNDDKKAALYYLTLFGTAPDPESTGQGALKEEQYTRISYATDILNWLEACRKEAANIPTVRETITQYIQLIRKLTNQHFDGKMQSELISKILANPDHLASFVELQSPALYQTVKTKIIEKLEADLQDLAASLSLHLNLYLKNRKRWQGFTFAGDPNMQALSIWPDFQFDVMPHRLLFGFSYMPDAAGNPQKPAFSLEPLQQRFKDAYPGSKKETWWPAYQYWEDYSPEAIMQDIYFSTKFKENVKDKLLQLLEMVRLAKEQIQTK